MTTLRRSCLSRYSNALTKLPVNFHPEEQELLSKAVAHGPTELVLRPRYQETPISVFWKLKKLFPKLVCLTLLALIADKGFPQESKPREDKPKTNILDKILKKAGDLVNTADPEPLPKDFEKKAKREYEQIEDPDISYPRYLETRKQEYRRLSQLKMRSSSM